MNSNLSVRSRLRLCFVLLLVTGLVAVATATHADETSKPGNQPSDQSGEQPASEKLIPGPFVHVALYTFKADAPPNVAAEFAAEAEKCFAQIDMVKSFRIGQPAAKSTPKEFMVGPGGNYDLGTVTTFDNYAGMAKYGNDKRHNELKKKYAKYFEKILTYDFDSNPASDSVATARPATTGAEVTGRVTVDGQPLGNGSIQFHLPDGKSFGAKLKEDGTFSVQNLARGKVTISFSSKLLPEKFTDEEKSALQLEVQPGANTADFDLRSR
jgi:hypothetical protein